MHLNPRAACVRRQSVSSPPCRETQRLNFYSRRHVHRPHPGSASPDQYGNCKRGFMSRRCMCVDALVKEEKKSAFFQTSRKQMSSVKKCNSSLISSECCKSASVMEEDGGGGYFCVIPVYLWHMKTWHNKCTSFMVHPDSFLSLSEFMRGFILVCLLRTKLLQACFVSAVFFRRWPRKDSLGASGGGDAEDDTHLLREKPPAAHQETR